MQTVKLPTLTCEEIEAHSRSFIWGSTNEKKKPHLVKWEQVCQPKVNGGLGVGRMSQNNEAFLMKLGWGINHSTGCGPIEMLPCRTQQGL